MQTASVASRCNVRQEMREYPSVIRGMARGMAQVARSRPGGFVARIETSAGETVDIGQGLQRGKAGKSFVWEVEE